MLKWGGWQSVRYTDWGKTRECVAWKTKLGVCIMSAHEYRMVEWSIGCICCLQVSPFLIGVWSPSRVHDIWLVTCSGRSWGNLSGSTVRCNKIKSLLRWPPQTINYNFVSTTLSTDRNGQSWTLYCIDITCCVYYILHILHVVYCTVYMHVTCGVLYCVEGTCLFTLLCTNKFVVWCSFLSCSNLCLVFSKAIRFRLTFWR